jgi:hypothetical protein
LTQSLGRPALVVTFIVNEVYQVFFGAFTSLQLGAPGVGDRASWVPNFLVAEAFTILPLGFVLRIWGARVGRPIATICAVAMLLVALAGSVTLSRSLGELFVFFGLLAPPWIALLVSGLRRSSRP